MLEDCTPEGKPPSFEGVTVDVFLPSERIALGRQGEQWQSTKWDAERRRRCEEAGVTLIEVPFWWAGDKSSLASTIHRKRPDLLGDPALATGAPSSPEGPPPVAQGNSRDTRAGLKFASQFFARLGGKLGFREMDDWYGLTQRDISVNGGAGILKDFGESIPRALQCVFPDHRWLPWRFKKVPNGFWQDATNRKDFVEWLGKELKFERMEDWYSVTLEQIRRFGGRSLSERYGNSPAEILGAVFPDHRWQPWRFSCAPKGFWDSVDNARDFMEWMSKELNLADLGDWHDVSTEAIRKKGGWDLLNRYGGKLRLLSTLYPLHPWETNGPTGTRHKTQALLFGIVRGLFPQHEAFLEFKHPELVYSPSMHPMQVSERDTNPISSTSSFPP